MNQVFIEVLNNALIASFLILAIVALRFCFRRAPRWLYCVLWGLVAVKLIIPLQIESVLSLIPSAAPIPADIEYAPVPHLETGISAVNNVVNPVLETNFAPLQTASVNPLQILISQCASLWLAGMAVLCIYSLISFLILRRKVAAAKPVAENVFVCDEIDGPFILGIARPRIYLPSGISEQTKACVLEHERAHLRRGDHFWKPFGFLILTVYWFNPLCWLAYVLLCKDIELACDEKVTAGREREWRASYCQALLDCNVGRRMIAACPVAFGEVGVKERVKSVLCYKKPTFWLIFAAVAASLVVTVCFMTNPKVKAESGKMLTLEELLTQSASADWIDVQAREGIAYWEQYGNLRTNENVNPQSLTNLYTWDFEKDDKEFELQIAYWQGEEAARYGHGPGAVEYVFLCNKNTQDRLRLYADGAGCTDREIEAFLNKTYEDFKNIPLLAEQTEKLGSGAKVTFGEYEMELFLDFSGRFLECGEYVEPEHGEGAPKAWYALGGVGTCRNPNYEDLLVFRDGRLVECNYLGNHMTWEKVGEVFDVGDEGYSGCVYKYEFELFTMPEMEFLDPKVPLTLEYWVIFLTKGEGEPLYVEFFNSEYFTVAGVS